MSGAVRSHAILRSAPLLTGCSAPALGTTKKKGEDAGTGRGVGKLKANLSQAPETPLITTVAT